MKTKWTEYKVKEKPKKMKKELYLREDINYKTCEWCFYFNNNNFFLNEKLKKIKKELSEIKNSIIFLHLTMVLLHVMPVHHIQNRL